MSTLKQLTQDSNAASPSGLCLNKFPPPSDKLIDFKWSFRINIRIRKSEHGGSIKTVRQDTARTRKNLLAAAIDIFAEKGYRDATIAEMSERAGTNVASVNYHFGDKETLYREAWRQSFRDSLQAHPPDGGVANDAPAKERLRARIVSLLHRITDNNNKEFLIVHKELANPTGLLEEVILEELQPLRRKIQDLVRELLGPLPSDTQVRFCAIGIIGQCIMPTFLNRIEKDQGEPDSWRVDDIENYAEHVINFSLAGMRAVRDGTVKG